MEFDYLSEWKRTTYGGDLRIDDVGQEVTLFGWVHNTEIWEILCLST